MIKSLRLGTVSIIALFGGILTAFAYVNYSTNEIHLSTLVFCLSGRDPSNSLMDMFSLTMQFLPVYVFCAVTGTSIYQRFCTASVFVFSRQPKRIRWYIREWINLFLTIVLFQTIYIGATIITTTIRLEVVYNLKGVRTLAYHFLIHTLWICFLSVLINIFSIFLGSDVGFVLGISVNTVLVTILASPRMEGLQKLVAVNPISRLILGWHNIDVGNDCILDNTKFLLDINASVVYMVVLNIAVMIVCGVVVVRYDLLTGNKETGGF